MSGRIKSRQEIVTQAYLNKADIGRLLKVPPAKASKIYGFARQIDDEELKYIIYETAVRMTSVCKVTGVTLNVLLKQIKEEA